MKKYKLPGVPNEKQAQFFLSAVKYTAYGGARGGGKSWAVRRKAALLCFRYAGIKVLIIRRTLPELRENHTKPLQTELIPSGRVIYNDTHKCFYFKNGSSISLGYCDNESDTLRYQGQEYDIIALDEATQLSEFQFNIFKACLRGANLFPKRIYITCNPGGVGHAWVKRLFIDRDFRAGEQAEEHRFIAASVYDNKALLESDSEYLSQLESLPYELREAWLNGRWDVFAGQYFSEFERGTHTIEHRTPEKDSVHYVAIDYGLDMFAALFVAVERSGRAYVYDEIYEKNLIVSEAAGRLSERAGQHGVHPLYIAPSDLWSRQKDSGRTVCDLFADGGIYLTRLTSARVEGWLALKEWLKPGFFAGEDGIAEKRSAMVISARCVNLIRCLPLLLHDEHEPSDAATQPHEITHAPDALRYFAAYQSARPYGSTARDIKKLSQIYGGVTSSLLIK